MFDLVVQARRANERPSSRIISTFFENGVVPPADLDPSESSESAEDEDQEVGLRDK